MTRPTCACCGKLYGRRDIHTESLKWPIGEPRPPYIGNGVVVKEGFTYQTTSRETVRKVTMLSSNPEIRAYQEQDIARTPEQSFNASTRDIWDGETWTGGYDPFCTLRCALAYARKAHRRVTGS